MKTTTQDAPFAPAMKAALFDMDGTLLDSMTCWRRLNVEFVRRQGFVPTAAQEEALMRLSGTLVVPYLREQFGIQSDFDTLCAQACAAMEPIYAAGLPPKPGVVAFLRRLRARGVLCVVATATPEPLARLALERSGLTPLLDHITSTETLGLQKHSAAFYDRLCGMLGVAQGDCVMFEDALYAMRGARSAGLGVVGITDPTNLHDREAILTVCDRVIDTYDELP